MPAAAPGAAPRGESDVMNLPPFLDEPFAGAMSQSILLPAFVALFGVMAAIFLVGGHEKRNPGPAAAEITDRAYGRHAADQSKSTAGLR